MTFLPFLKNNSNSIFDVDNYQDLFGQQKNNIVYWKENLLFWSKHEYTKFIYYILALIINQRSFNVSLKEYDINNPTNHMPNEITLNNSFIINIICLINFSIVILKYYNLLR